MKRTAFYLSICLILVLVILATALSCSGSTSTTTNVTSATTTAAAQTTTSSVAATTTASSEQPQKGGTLKLQYSRLPTSSIGWPATVLPSDSSFLDPAIETLVIEDYDFNIKPRLATSWDIPADKSSVTFHLRQGVKFHDGSDFNADVVKFNLDAVKAAKHQGTDDWTSIDVIDPYTIRVSLSRWQTTALERFTTRTGQMISKAAVDKNGVDWAKINPVGTGPFTFVSLQKDVSLEFKRFDNYWVPGKPYLDGIKWSLIKDPVTQVAAFTAGEIDVMAATDAQVLTKAAAVPGAYLKFAYDGAVVMYPDARNADSPLSNKLVRQAIDYAINKEDIAAAVGYGIFGAAPQLPFPGTIGNIAGQNTARSFDPAKAKALLAEAGYKDGFDITLAIENAARKDTQTAVASFLGDVGIRCNSVLWDNATYNQHQVSGWNNTLILAPGSGRNFTVAMQTYFLTPSYYPSLKGPDGFADLVNAALGTVSLEKDKVEAVSKAIFEDAGMIPVYYMGMGRVYMQNKIHDPGYLQYASQMDWSPADIWLSK